MKLEHQGLFATPKTLETLTEYLNNFNGSEGVVAWTAFGMTWNLIRQMLIDAEEDKTEEEEKAMALRHACEAAIDSIDDVICTLEDVKRDIEPED